MEGLIHQWPLKTPVTCYLNTDIAHFWHRTHISPDSLYRAEYLSTLHLSACDSSWSIMWTNLFRTNCDWKKSQAQVSVVDQEHTKAGETVTHPSKEPGGPKLSKPFHSHERCWKTRPQPGTIHLVPWIINEAFTGAQEVALSRQTTLWSVSCISWQWLSFDHMIDSFIWIIND